MEGRSFDREGNDVGDTWFHTVAMEVSPEQERVDLETMTAEEVAFGMKQAEQFAAQDPSLGAKAFRGLCVLYPDHSNIPLWNTRATELETK